MTVSEQAGEFDLESAESDDRIAGLGRYVTLADGVTETFDVTEKYTQEVVGTLPACQETDVREAFERAREAQESWAERPVSEREEIVLDFHDLVLDHDDELLDVVQVETGKSRRHAHEGVMDVAINARHYGHRAEDYLARERREAGVPGAQKTWEHHHPVGVVGMITPWNYPLSLTASDAIPALLAGNAVVIKPAPDTPYSALKAKALLEEAGLPADLFQIVPGYGPEIGDPLIEECDYFGFTGSSDTGSLVAAKAGEHLTKCSLELGGKNPAIVCEDADIDKAVEGLVRGCFTNAGQICISIERLYVHESVRDEFVEKFVAATEALELGATYDYSVDVGCLIHEEHLEKVEEHVEDARTRGATVECGGTARPDLGPTFYEPTVLTDVPEESLPCCEETFGPVVGIYEFSDEEEAIERANDSEYGLNGSVWTEDYDRGVDIAFQVECGTVNVNEGYAAAFAAVDAPMGGMKKSGIGRRHGDEGIMKYTESQNVTLQKAGTMSAPPGVPYGIYATGVNYALRLIEKIPGLR
ncbi:succinic semialdehyde dehydrogenase [Halobacteriales archaeon QS_4_70_19]|nr:MAG: succinic semialdehyde dehydrogenase [Halobacteriales archaeon QS_4_70_19]